MSAGIINGNTFALGCLSFVFDPASVAANTSVEQTVTVRGLKVNDLVFVSKPTTTAGLIVGTARVTAADTLGITLANCTAAPIDAASETWGLFMIRPENGALRATTNT